jgi:predicted kinase
MKSLQLDKPHAIVVVGIQGSGKTFFASKFADAFNAPFLEQSVFDAAARDNSTAEKLMTDMLQELLKTGSSIIVEHSLSSRVNRVELTRLLKKAGYVPLFVWVQVDLETAMTRAPRQSGVDKQMYESQMRRFVPPHPSERPLVISGKHTFATQAKAVLRKLSTPRQTPAQPITRAPQPPQTPQRGQIIVR